MLREGILTSERVDSLAAPAEVFYRRLMSVVDDFGRYYAKPELLLAALYPLRVGKVRNADIATWTRCVEKAGLVRRYTANGKEYLELLDFRQQVRAKESRFPDPPPENAQQSCSTCVADAQQLHTKTLTKSETNTGPPGASADEGFARFWAAYPRKIGKADALKAWGKVKPDKALQDRILQAVEQAAASRDWLRDDGKFVPHPTTWLNGRRWEDEYAPAESGRLPI